MGCFTLKRVLQHVIALRRVHPTNLSGTALDQQCSIERKDDVGNKTSTVQSPAYNMALHIFQIPLLTSCNPTNSHEQRIVRKKIAQGQHDVLVHEKQAHDRLG